MRGTCFLGRGVVGLVNPVFGQVAVHGDGPEMVPRAIQVSNSGECWRGRACSAAVVHGVVWSAWPRGIVAWLWRLGEPRVATHTHINTHTFFHSVHGLNTLPVWRWDASPHQASLQVPASDVPGQQRHNLVLRCSESIRCFTATMTNPQMPRCPGLTTGRRPPLPSPDRQKTNGCSPRRQCRAPRGQY